jgi:hypothetical protein
MQDPPSGEYMLGLIASFLRNEVMPQLSGSLAFQVRVAANAVDLVQREMALGPASEAAERRSLIALLGGGDAEADLAALNEDLCARIRERKITLETPGLVDHLRQTMLAKLAVDQPHYSAFERARQAWTSDDNTAA